MSKDDICESAIELADRLREEGNGHYRIGCYREAIEKYIAAREIYERSGSTVWVAKIWCNLSLAYLKLNEPQGSLESADKAVELNPSNCKAYYRRASALENLGRYEGSVNDYVVSFELTRQRKIFYQALALAATHSAPICGMRVTKLYKDFIKESAIDHTSTSPYSRYDLIIMFKEALQKEMFGVIPIFKFVLRAEVSCCDIIKVVGEESEVKRMIDSISSHSEYLKAKPNCENMLRETRVMGAEFVRAALEQESARLVELFLGPLEIERGIIDISDLLERKGLCYRPGWLGIMLKKGADFQKCTHNPIKVVLRKDYTQSGIKLEMIKILLQNGAALPTDIPHSKILHEVIKCTLKCNNGTVDALKIVCAKVDFTSNNIRCDDERKSPWHLALGAKRNKTSIEVCRVLKGYPIDPSLTDREGKRADIGRKDHDERVKIMREKEAEMNKGFKQLSGSKVELNKSRRGGKDVAGTNEESLEKDMTTLSLASNFKPGNHLNGQSLLKDDSSLTEGKNQRTLSPSKPQLPINLDKVRGRAKSIRDTSKAYNELVTERTGTHDCCFAPQDDICCECVLEQGEEFSSAVDTPEQHENTGCGGGRGKSSPHEEEQDEDPDGAQWAIEQSKKVKKTLQREKNKHILKQFFTKMKMLSEGEFMGNTKHCKSVTSKKGAELYETRLNKKSRVLWQVVSKCKEEMCRQTIRVWDVVLNHDKIHHRVQTILHKGSQAKKTPKASKKKGTSAAAPNVHNNRRKPLTFMADKDERDRDDGDDSDDFSPIPL